MHAAPTLCLSSAPDSASDREPSGARRVIACRPGTSDVMPVPNAMRAELRALFAVLLRCETGSRPWTKAAAAYGAAKAAVIRHLFGIDLTADEARTRVAFDHDFAAAHRPIIEA